MRNFGRSVLEKYYEEWKVNEVNAIKKAARNACIKGSLEILENAIIELGRSPSTALEKISAYIGDDWRVENGKEFVIISPDGKRLAIKTKHIKTLSCLYMDARSYYTSMVEKDIVSLLRMPKSTLVDICKAMSVSKRVVTDIGVKHKVIVYAYGAWYKTTTAI